jgi:sodium/proline symporter
MPHIIIRFMAIRSQKEVKKSAIVGISWTVLILLFSVAVASVGRMFLGNIEDSSLVFIMMVRKIFPGVISGILVSAILAAAMSTADSQLLASASAFAADVYKPVLRKDAGEGEMFWAGRFVVAIIAFVAVAIAANPKSGTIMSLVGNAWGVFGAAFGPAILLSLFWKRFTFFGAIAGIVAGATADVIWLAAFSSTGLYEIIPGFVIGTIAAIVVTLCGKDPGADVKALYDKSVALKD